MKAWEAVDLERYLSGGRFPGNGIAQNGALRQVYLWMQLPQKAEFERIRTVTSLYQRR
jgi:hypothetical protein